MKKRVLAMLMLLCMTVSVIPASAAGEAVVTVSEVTVDQDGTAEVEVSLTGNPGLAAWMFELHWDTSVLTLDTSGEIAEAGDAWSSGTLLAKKTESGMTVSWFDIRNADEDGLLFRFTLKADGAAGTYPITAVCSEENTLNVKEQPVSITASGGSVTVLGAETGGDSAENEEDSSAAPEEELPPQQGGETAENPFLDVEEGAFYHDAVLWAVSRNITAGTTPVSFSPGKTCTRAQTVTFLWRAAGSPEPVVMNNPFSDVASGSYYYKAVLWAAENGITGGTTETSFSPGATVTRAQVVTFLWRAFGSERTAGENPFNDVAEGRYYSDAVLWAAENGITGGTTATTFSPMNGCTRAQIVTFLYRAYKGEMTL